MDHDPGDETDIRWDEFPELDPLEDEVKIIDGMSVLERLTSIVGVVETDMKSQREFSDMFDCTEIPELKFTIELTERQQQLICQGLGVLMLLLDKEDERQARLAQETMRRIQDAIHLAFAAQPEEQVQARKDFFREKKRNDIARLLGLDPTQLDEPEEDEEE